MKKYFCVADVHSFYDEMICALNKAGYDKNNPDHIFVSCGDLFDRGPQAREMLEFVNSIPNERKILIMGNHEILMRQMIWNGMYPRMIDKMNGTWQTACDITGADSAEVLEKCVKMMTGLSIIMSVNIIAKLAILLSLMVGFLACINQVVRQFLTLIGVNMIAIVRNGRKQLGLMV
jgi:serine/threonine protein phosphatase 1